MGADALHPDMIIMIIGWLDGWDCFFLSGKSALVIACDGAPVFISWKWEPAFMTVVNQC